MDTAGTPARLPGYAACRMARCALGRRGRSLAARGRTAVDRGREKQAPRQGMCIGIRLREVACHDRRRPGCVRHDV